MGALIIGMEIVFLSLGFWLGWEIGYYHGRFGAGRRS